MTKQLPPNLHLEHLKNEAKALLKAHRARDIAACRRIQQTLPRFSAAPVVDVREAGVSLREAQAAVANWKRR